MVEIYYPQIKEKVESKTLYVVATPIGNLSDITLRALYILENVDLIACEDTRHTALLLKHYGIEKPLLSFHSHSQEKRYTEIKELLKSQSIALVSDAGSPCISDPGAELAAYLIKEGFQVRPIPGPSALVAALSASGLDTREFTFRGFLGKRGLKNKVKEIMDCKEVQVIYESPQRIKELLVIINSYDPNREVVVSRELTKLYEEFFRGTVKESLNYFADKEIKGEITLLISGNTSENEYSELEIMNLLKDALDSGSSLRDATKELSKQLGVSKNVIYDLGLKIKD